MEQVSWRKVEDVHTDCNQLRSPGGMKQSSKLIESDLNSDYQDVISDKHSVTSAMFEDSYGKGDIDSSDEANESSELTPDPWSYEELMKASEWSSSFGGLNLPHNWNEIPRSQRLKILEDKLQEFFPNLPKTLLRITIGTMFPGDCGRLPSEVPDWLDRKKFNRGQRFQRDNAFGILYANALSLYVLYSFEDSLKFIIYTGRSVDPYRSFKRFLSTEQRLRNWKTTDPWTEGTPAYRDIRTVRRLHASARKKANELSLSELDKATRIDEPLVVRRKLLLEDFRDACPVAKYGQCPLLMPEYREKRPNGMNQGEMTFTTFGFIGLLILHPEAFGIHDATEEDLDAFCHFWRGITYLLGISDEFNYCDGSFTEIKQRSHDLVEYWVKINLRDITPEFEHMMRCIYEGGNFYLSSVTYDGGLLYLTELLGLDMPRLKASMTYSSWLKYYFMKKLLQYPCRFKWIKNYLNNGVYAAMDRALAFDNEKHAQLREQSAKIVATILGDRNL